MLSKLKKLGLSFWLIVFTPTFLSTVYFGLIASDRYVSVSSFVVRSPQKSTSASGLSAFLQNVGFSRSADDGYIVHQYMLSRDVVRQLNETIDLRNKYANSHVDFISRFHFFGKGGGLEDLYEYYQKRVNIDTDSTSSISSLTVRAYTAKDAYAINSKLLELAEGLINQLNERGRYDMIASSEREVNTAITKVNEASNKLTEFRANNKIIDVGKQSELRMQIISKLQDQLILVKTQMTQLRAITPNNPQILVLQKREEAIQREMDKQTSLVLFGSSSLNQKSGEYERLLLEKDVATKQLSAAMALLEQNRNEAQRKQLYLERISQPNLPDVAIEPKRLKNIISTFLLSLIVWGVFSLLTAGIKEHQG